MITTIRHSAVSAELADRVAADLASARLMEGRVFLRLPILFGSGTHLVAVIEVEPDGLFRVSDLGQGYEEASQMGVATAYLRRARATAPAAGLRLMDRELAFLRVPERALPAACAALSSHVLRLVEHAAAVGAAARVRDGRTRFADRLRELFPNRRVEVEAPLRGASLQEWSVDVLLEDDGRRAVFDFVKPHLTSVSLEVAKTGDLAALESPPRCISVVRRKAAFGPMLALLSQHASVIEEDAPRPSIERAAA
ncbi:hypothetical protein [Sabulicella glaciei]|uniref:DUF1828 domain-containing protein n=1 Tax=Sabulicella glaciei TaxID=2984948 RepID=A0ABT3P0U8_9PROT|nr:hypothetical protein [Roseococcus sp. MDT2-1-1]MCW8088031.1 hypothetical protein [Roseococcus sp. MDT2-1-1]